MRKYAVLCGMLAASLAFTGCGKKPAPETTAAVQEQADKQTAGDSAKEDNNQDNKAEAKEYDLYKNMDGIIFGFMSGVGAWETTLEIAPDGSFTGQFYDANMGECGEGYSNGTLYESTFSGQLSEPVAAGEHRFEADVIELTFPEKTEDGKDRYIDEDETLHILTSPYGMAANSHIIFYEPGMVYADTDENFKSWVFIHFWDNEPETLDTYAFYNETVESGWYPDTYAMGTEEHDDSYEDGEETEYYLGMKNAYANQKFPDDAALPGAPIVSNYVDKAYESVTYENLQGTWIHEYDEAGHHYEEILSVTGEKGRIECYEDGVPTYAWNGEGYFSIEDRSERNVCPAVRINDPYDDSNICTIYVRWVKEDKFFDGGFLTEWKRVPAGKYNYLFDTVTLDNLQGVWYSEYFDDAGFYQDVLTVDGDHGTIFETVDGKPSKVWNGEGTISFSSDTFGPQGEIPEFILKYDDGSGSMGIYIADVDSDKFFDPAFMRYWIKINPWEQPWYYYELEYDGGGENYYFDGESYNIAGNNMIKITPKGSSRDDEMTNIWHVEVTNYNGAKLELDQEIDPHSGYTPEYTGVVYEADVNFDGLYDVLVFQGIFGTRGVEYDKCYLNLGDKFVECEGFDEIGDPYVDDVDRRICSTMRDTASSYYQMTYEVQGTKAVQTSQKEFQYDEEKEDYIEVTR